MSPALSRRLAIVVQPMDMDARFALIAAVEDAGEASAAAHDLLFQELPRELREEIQSLEREARRA